MSCGLRVMREGAWRKDLGKEVKDEHWSPLLGSPVQHRVFEARLIEKPHIENRESGVSEQVGSRRLPWDGD